MGVGIGGLVGTVAGPDGQQVPYREFVAPGLLAVSALNGALADSTFNIYGRLKFEKLYDAVLTTPLGARDVAFAEIGWAVLRGMIYSVSFLIVMAAMGLISSPWAILALPGAGLIAFATAAIGVFLTSFMKSWQDFDYVMLVSVPLFLFSGTFYPISVYPHVIGVIVQWTPLYQGVVILRDLVLGVPSPDLLWRGGVPARARRRRAVARWPADRANCCLCEQEYQPSITVRYRGAGGETPARRCCGRRGRRGREQCCH